MGSCMTLDPTVDPACHVLSNSCYTDLAERAQSFQQLDIYPYTYELQAFIWSVSYIRLTHI